LQDAMFSFASVAYNAHARIAAEDARTAKSERYTSNTQERQP